METGDATTATLPDRDGTVAPAPEVPVVGYLVLGDDPHLQAQRCTACGALYFDRRNGCARCFGTEFETTRLSNEGTVRAYTIVHRAAPNVPAPYTSVVVDLQGGGVVKSVLVGATDPEVVTPRLPVRLTTFEVGQDDNGTKAIAFGYEIAEAAA